MCPARRGGREEGGTIGPVELSPPERRIVATTVYRYLLLYVWMGAVASDCAAHDDAAHDDAERFGFTMPNPSGACRGGDPETVLVLLFRKNWKMPRFRESTNPLSRHDFPS